MASVNTLPSSNTTSPTSTLDILHEEEGGGMEVSSRLLPTNVHTSSSRRSNLIKKKTIIVNKGEKDVVGITLEEDTFTMMMAADLKENKISWWLGVLCFVTQCSLISLVFISENRRDMPNRSTLDMPIIVPNAVRVGQFFALILCLLNSSDIIGSIQNLTMLWFRSKGDNGTPHWGNESSHTKVSPLSTTEDDDNYIHVLFESKRTFGKWLIRVFVPLFLKLSQGILVLLVSTLVIMRADNIIDLLKDYTALIVISDIDNAVFLLAKHGYLGNRLQEAADDSEEVEVQDQKVKKWRFFGFAIIVILLFGLYSTVIYYQDNMFFLNDVYPYCQLSFAQQNGRNFTIQDLHELSNGKCDNFQGFGANINLCGFESGECRDLNDDYSDCNPVANDLKKNVAKELSKPRKALYEYGPSNVADEFMTTLYSAEMSRGNITLIKPYQLGDGECDEVLDTPECSYDANDCMEKDIGGCDMMYKGDNYKFKLGDGECDIILNTEECKWDNGDCLSENDLFDIKAYNIDCGSHKALTCGQCVFAPGGKIDSDLCGGDCEWDEGNFCKAKKPIQCKTPVENFKEYVDRFADYSQRFLNELEEDKIIGEEAMPPTCGSCVYDHGLFTKSNNCGSKNSSGKFLGPDCFWNDQNQECQHIDTVLCSDFKEDKDECGKFQKCFFNDSRNLCEDNCSSFLYENDCLETDFCRYERNPNGNGGTCKQAICDQIGTEGECNQQNHCFYDNINTKCVYHCAYIWHYSCFKLTDHCEYTWKDVNGEVVRYCREKGQTEL